MFKQYKYMILDTTTGRIAAVILSTNYPIGHIIGPDIKIIGKLIKG